MEDERGRVGVKHPPITAAAGPAFVVGFGVVFLLCAY